MKHLFFPLRILTAVCVVSGIALSIGATQATPTLEALVEHPLPRVGHARHLRWSPAGSSVAALCGNRALILDVASGRFQELPLKGEQVWMIDWESEEDLIYKSSKRGRSSIYRLTLDRHSDLLQEADQLDLRGFRQVRPGLYTMAGSARELDPPAVLSLGGGKPSWGTATGDRFISYTFALDGTQALWHFDGVGQAQRIEYPHEIYAGHVPNDREGLVAFRSLDGVDLSTVVIDLDGTIIGRRSQFLFPYSWHPQDNLLLLGYETEDGDHDIIRSSITLWDVGNDSYDLLTDGRDLDSDPVWSPDGARIAFYRSEANSIVVGNVRRK